MKRVSRRGANYYHDAVLRVLADMMQSAGFEDVQMEDRWWDEGDAETKDTRRPDITAFNPRDRRRYVIDVVCVLGLYILHHRYVITYPVTKPRIVSVTDVSRYHASSASPSA